MNIEELTFRRSRWALPMILSGIAVLWWLATVLVQVFLFDDPWYDGWPQVPVILAVIVVLYLRGRREGGLPLRLTRDHLVLTHSDGEPLAIGWDNLAVARVTGRITPVLVVEPRDPERTEPPLGQWGRSRSGQPRPSRSQRPYEIRVSLTGMRPGVRRLRSELEARLGSEQHRPDRTEY